jgi:hypothetical protein
MDKIEYDYLSDREIEKIMREEEKYRMAHGDTCVPDGNLCKYCRNIDRQNHFCWDCDSGSKYLPITRPLFNLFLMFLSLNSGLEEAEKNKEADKIIIFQQKGVIEALRFVMEPFGLNNVVKKFKNEIMNNKNDHNAPAEIENIKMKYSFKQEKETEEENDYRGTVGTIRCHTNACTYCKYNYRFSTKFCWDCDRGTNFKNGIRSMQTIEKMLMFLNTESGEAIMSHDRNDEMTIIRMGMAEGLKWIIEPYTTEEELIEKNGFEYIGKEDMNFTIQMEDEEYDALDNYDKIGEDDHENQVEDKDPMKTIEDNIPKFIEKLIIAGDDDSIIIAKVTAELMILGLDLSDPSELEKEISSIRQNLLLDK